MPIALLRNYPATVTSHMAIYRLRELHYERTFYNQKVPTASTFAFKSASTMDYLLAFASIIRWLLERLGSKLQTFSEFDEPNAIALEIINACKPFVSSQDLAPHDLRQGSGDAVCALLLALAEAALEKLTIYDLVWKENQSQTAAVDNYDDEEDEDEFIDDVYMASFYAGPSGPNLLSQRQLASTEIAPGVADVHKWQEEQIQAEYALNATKYNSYVQDWRPDIQKLTSLAYQLNQESQGITQQLTVVSDGIGKQLERLVQREQFLNQQIASFSGKLIEVSRTHQGLYKESDEIYSEIAVLNEQLAETNDKFKRLKAEMTAENNRITDTTGLASAKTAIGTLSNEIRDLDLRIILAYQRLFGQPSQ